MVQQGQQLPKSSSHPCSRFEDLNNECGPQSSSLSAQAEGFTPLNSCRACPTYLQRIWSRHSTTGKRIQQHLHVVPYLVELFSCLHTLILAAFHANQTHMFCTMSWTNSKRCFWGISHRLRLIVSSADSPTVVVQARSGQNRHEHGHSMPTSWAGAPDSAPNDEVVVVKALQTVSDAHKIAQQTREFTWYKRGQWRVAVIAPNLSNKESTRLNVPRAKKVRSGNLKAV